MPSTSIPTGDGRLSRSAEQRENERSDSRPARVRSELKQFFIAAVAMSPLPLLLCIGMIGEYFTQPKADAQVARCEQVVEEWLNEQRKGKSGEDYWPSIVYEPARLFAVREWEIVDRDHFGSGFTVRIASSNRAGFPIEKLWKISLTDWNTEAPKIWRVEEAVKD